MFSCVVVDDDQDSLEVFCELLDLFGVNILARGKNGKEAKKLYEKYQPDVIFIDLLMPKYDGFNAIEKITHMDPKAKIVIVTGDLKIGEASLLDTYDVEAVLYKPFETDMLKRVISYVFSVQSLK
ncbi:MAG: response regulator [Candidatus Nitrosopumilus sp. bin_7KS]